MRTEMGHGVLRTWSEGCGRPVYRCICHTHKSERFKGFTLLHVKLPIKTHIFSVAPAGRAEHGTPAHVLGL